MTLTHGLLTALRTLLGLAFAVLVAAQLVVLPAMLAAMPWAMLAVSVLELVCVQVVIVCTWRLLTMVEQDRIFSEESFTWVNAIMAAVGAGWLLLLGSFASVLDLWRSPELSVALLIVLVAVSVLGLLMVVMRALLRQATVLRADLEAVI